MTDAAFNKPGDGASYAWLHVLNAILLLGLWVFAIAAYPGLPEQVPGHIGGSGVTRWDAKQNSPWFILPIIALVNGAMMYGVSAISRSTPGSFNVPAKDRLMKLPREGQLYAMAPMRGFMYGLATWLLALFGYIQFQIYRIAHAGPGADVATGGLLWVTLLMVAVVVFMALRLSRVVKRRIMEWKVVAVLALALAGCGDTGRADESAVAATGDVDAADTWATVRESGGGTIRVLYVPAGGFAYRDGDGRLTGVTVEIMRQFAEWVGREYGVTLDAEFVEEEDWRTFYNRVRDAGPGVFGIGNVTITEARRDELRFSPSYLTNVAVLITHEDVPELARLEDADVAFHGLDALAFEGTLHETRLRQLRDAHVPGADMTMASTNDEILERVAGGGYFAYIDAYNFWRARDGGAPLRRHTAGDDPAEEFGVIMPLGTDWGELIDRFFQRDGGYRGTAEYHELLVRHLGEPLTRALEDARAAAGGT